MKLIVHIYYGLFNFCLYAGQFMRYAPDKAIFIAVLAVGILAGLCIGLLATYFISDRAVRGTTRGLLALSLVGFAIYLYFLEPRHFFAAAGEFADGIQVRIINTSMVKDARGRDVGVHIHYQADIPDDLPEEVSQMPCTVTGEENLFVGKPVESYLQQYWTYQTLFYPTDPQGNGYSWQNWHDPLAFPMKIGGILDVNTEIVLWGTSMDQVGNVTVTDPKEALRLSLLTGYYNTSDEVQLQITLKGACQLRGEILPEMKTIKTIRIPLNIREENFYRTAESLKAEYDLAQKSRKDDTKQ